MLKYVTFSLFSVFHFFAVAQSYPNHSSLNLREIMKGPDFVGHLPEDARWSITSEHILFDWNPEGLPGNETYAYHLKSKKSEKVTPDFYAQNKEFREGTWAKNQYYEYQGGLYYFDSKQKEAQLIYQSTVNIYNVHFYPQHPYVYFKEGNQLRSYCIEAKSIETIFVFKEGSAPSEAPEKESHWMREEQRLFQYLQEQEETAEWRETKREKWKHTIPYYHLGSEIVNTVQMSPDGKFLTFRLYTEANYENTHVEHHISKDGHTYTQNARPKVHNNDPNNRLAIYDFTRDSLYFADFSALSDIRKKPNYVQLYGDTSAHYEQDRNIIMHSLVYAETAHTNVLDVRSYDNKDRWIVSVNLETGTVKEHERQHDSAWIGGPGISSWNMVSGTLGWLPDNETVFFQSETSGFSHLYTLHLPSGKKEALTSGNWEVQEVSLNQLGSTFYLITNKTHSGDKGFYHLDIKTKKLTPVLTQSGAHEVSVSPDEKWLAVRYSYKNKPWEIYLAENKVGASLQPITHSTKKEFEAYDWTAPKVLKFKASDGVMVQTRLYEPEKTKANRAAVIFVHGAGYLQNAHNWWSSYYREYMFHNLLRDNGFTVLDIDFRASAGYGRDHRTAIYRHMGGKDLSDQLDGRQFLIDSMGIAPDRVGIYGGSYGGFITLMALLTEPGKFQGGAALRSVTDWNHYNHEYTSNILNYPSTDSLAYEKSSPIYYAENLADRLLMLHGMVDDNVQFQDVVRLSQRFIELGKENWELAVFPVEAHGFQKSYSWADEYRRIYELFIDELTKQNGQ